jgi:peptide/nickel transport system ATP-binding protein
MAETVLEVKDLTVEFDTEDGVVHAVDGISYAVRAGETLGIVGESGSGKSVSSLTVLGLTRSKRSRITGEVIFDGRNLLEMDSGELQSVRGGEISMIFQDPLSSLHPFYKIGDQLSEAVRAHQQVSKAAAVGRAIQLLDLVGIPEPRKRVGGYPHEFSGGMRQRVMIAMALVNDPDLLIADEPTTALDVTTQAQILELMNRLQREFGSAIIMITHDLGVIAEIADEVVVMYAAQVAERGTVEQLFSRPHHPYTWGLLGSLPRLDADTDRLVQIQGQPPSLLNPPRGCRFNPRCPYVMNVCKQQEPELRPISNEPEHLQACHLDEQTKDREAAKLLAGTLAQAS